MNENSCGTIIFGVPEEDSYDVVGVYNIENAQKKAMEACKQMEPSVRAEKPKSPKQRYVADN